MNGSHELKNPFRVLNANAISEKSLQSKQGGEKNMQTSTKIKRILKQEYPNARFKVRKETSSMHRAFNVYTDLIRDYDHQRYRELDQKLSEEGLKGEDLKEFEELEQTIERNKKIRRRIKSDLLSDFWHIDRNSRGEILSGGNTYLNVKRWEKTKYLS